jgi:hypothetical protein
MLAGIEEAFQAEFADQEKEMSAIDSLLKGLFDYAGLYPPAGVSMLVAANNYTEYSKGQHASALARFIVNAERVDELRSVAGDSFSKFKLSVIASENSDWDKLLGEIRSGVPIDTLEIRCSSAGKVDHFTAMVPSELAVYFEVSLDSAEREALKSITAAGGRAKIRMGGVVADAFPVSSDVVRMLQAMAERRLMFKATAGLHHPLRSRRPLTYQPKSPQGVMHGFLNLCCAAAIIYFDGDRREAEAVLEEEDPSAWRVSADRIECHNQGWTMAQIDEVRAKFLISIGSCSFEEPIRDLRELGWL